MCPAAAAAAPASHVDPVLGVPVVPVPVCPAAAAAPAPHGDPVLGTHTHNIQKKLKNTHTHIAGQCPLIVSVSVVFTE
jgi:hypothetical protein